MQCHREQSLFVHDAELSVVKTYIEYRIRKEEQASVRFHVIERDGEYVTSAA